MEDWSSLFVEEGIYPEFADCLTVIAFNVDPDNGEVTSASAVFVDGGVVDGDDGFDSVRTNCDGLFFFGFCWVEL